MESLIIITNILGILFVVLGMSLFANKKAVNSLLEEATKNGAVMWLFGFLSLLMGAIVITFVNSWNSNLEILITILGWLMLLKGIILLIIPSAITSVYRKIKGDSLFSLGGVIVLIIGLILMFSI
jgi:uncharacterized membrane protein HdeD (DUF308 family)